MKAILEFEMPVDAEAHHDAVHGSDWRWAIQELDDYFRNQIKHGENSADELRTFDRVRDRLTEILEDRGLSLY